MLRRSTWTFFSLYAETCLDFTKHMHVSALGYVQFSLYISDEADESEWGWS